MELSGIIEDKGANVQNFDIGDAVYGDISKYGFGSFAEYICIHKNGVIKKPDTISFEEAAALPHASLLALQALKDKAHLKNGQKVLINGGGGGVGTFGFQLAKLYNCEVTGVDTGKKLDMMKDIGFDYVIDYKKENFTKNGVKYDVILDCKSSKSAFSYFRSLSKNGIYVTVGGKFLSMISIVFWGQILSSFFSKKIKLLALTANDGLQHIGELFTQQKIKCVIDGPYDMTEIPRLIQYFGEGLHQGKIVIKMSQL